MNKECVFCNTPVAAIKECYVCHNCKTVHFTKKIPKSVIEQKINEYLKTVQNWIEINQAQLNSITEKISNGNKLSYEEKKKYKTLASFASIRKSLILYFQDNLDISDKLVCRELYDLLLISDEIKSITGV